MGCCVAGMSTAMGTATLHSGDAGPVQGHSDCRAAGNWHWLIIVCTAGMLMPTRQGLPVQGLSPRCNAPYLTCASHAVTAVAVRVLLHVADEQIYNADSAGCCVDVLLESALCCICTILHFAILIAVTFACLCSVYAVLVLFDEEDGMPLHLGLRRQAITPS